MAELENVDKDGAQMYIFLFLILTYIATLLCGDNQVKYHEYLLTTGFSAVIIMLEEVLSLLRKK